MDDPRHDGWSRASATGAASRRLGQRHRAAEPKRSQTRRNVGPHQIGQAGSYSSYSMIGENVRVMDGDRDSALRRKRSGKLRAPPTGRDRRRAPPAEISPLSGLAWYTDARFPRHQQGIEMTAQCSTLKDFSIIHPHVRRHHPGIPGSGRWGLGAAWRRAGSGQSVTIAARRYPYPIQNYAPRTHATIPRMGRVVGTTVG